MLELSHNRFESSVYRFRQAPTTILPTTCTCTSLRPTFICITSCRCYVSCVICRFAHGSKIDRITKSWKINWLSPVVFYSMPTSHARNIERWFETNNPFTKGVNWPMVGIYARWPPKFDPVDYTCTQSRMCHSAPLRTNWIYVPTKRIFLPRIFSQYHWAYVSYVWCLCWGIPAYGWISRTFPRALKVKGCALNISMKRKPYCVIKFPVQSNDIQLTF